MIRTVNQMQTENRNLTRHILILTVEQFLEMMSVLEYDGGRS